VGFCRNDRAIWAARSDGEVLLSPLEGPAKPERFSARRSISTALVSPGVSWLFSVDNRGGACRQYEIEKMREVRVLPEPVLAYDVVALSGSGDKIMLGGNEGAGVWKTETGEKVWQLGLDGLTTKPLAFSPDDRYLLTWVMTDDGDEFLKLIEGATGKAVWALKTEEIVVCACFAGDGKSFAIGRSCADSCYDDCVELWSTSEHRPIQTWRIKPDKDPRTGPMILRVSPCLTGLVVSPCGARAEFSVGHYIVVSSPPGGAGGRVSESFRTLRT